LHTPFAGRPKASQQAGAAKEYRHENPISQIARFGGDSKPRFSQILEKILVCAHAWVQAQRRRKSALFS
jgi:hypothetical protein